MAAGTQDWAKRKLNDVRKGASKGTGKGAGAAGTGAAGAASDQGASEQGNDGGDGDGGKFGYLAKLGEWLGRVDEAITGGDIAAIQKVWAEQPSESSSEDDGAGDAGGDFGDVNGLGTL